MSTETSAGCLLAHGGECAAQSLDTPFRARALCCRKCRLQHLRYATTSDDARQRQCDAEGGMIGTPSRGDRRDEAHAMACAGAGCGRSACPVSKGGTYPLSHLYGHFGLVRLCRLGHDVPWPDAVHGWERSPLISDKTVSDSRMSGMCATLQTNKVSRRLSQRESRSGRSTPEEHQHSEAALVSHPAPCGAARPVKRAPAGATA
jgi:hypothetical protein